MGLFFSHLVVYLVVINFYLLQGFLLWKCFLFDEKSIALLLVKTDILCHATLVNALHNEGESPYRDSVSLASLLSS